MNTSRFRRHSSLVPARRQGFTLIELLVVISIIAILAGLLLPVVSKVMENAKKVETKTAAVQVVTAIKAYQTEYGQYPTPDSSTGKDTAVTGDTTYTPTTGNAQLFKVLQASNTVTSMNDATVLAFNTRRIKYFDGRDAKNLRLPRSGFVPSTATSPRGNTATGAVSSVVAIGDLVDSWGNRFLVRIDSNYTDAVINPYSDDTAGAYDTDTTPATSLLRFGVLVWTYGNNGARGTMTTPGDDVLSWQ